MKALQVKVTLQDTVPAVWRTILFHPATGLDQVHDMLLIVMGWDDEYAPIFATDNGLISTDDDAYHEDDLEAYLAQPGDRLSYGFDSEADDYQLAIELLAIVEDSDDAQLPRVTDGANQAPPDGLENGIEEYNNLWKDFTDKASPRHAEANNIFSGIFAPNYFDAEEMNAQAAELFDGDMDGPDFDFGFDDDDDDYHFDESLLQDYDVDAGMDIPFEFEWLEREHGIKLSDGNVRNLPQEVFDFRYSLDQDEVEDPGLRLAILKPLYKKYPDLPMLAMEIAGTYAMTGELVKARQIYRNTDKRFSDHLEITTHRLLALDSKTEFLKAVSQLPHPLDIRNYPAGNDGCYHTTEFLSFEELAIREAVEKEQLNEARQRLDRLVRFGFLHGDVEVSALYVANLMIDHLKKASDQDTVDATVESFSTLSERTDAILEMSMIAVINLAVNTPKEEEEEEEKSTATVRRIGPRVGRNDPCPCGSGKKYKKCCL